MSILGILALMFGALIINVMFNLTRIAEKHNQDENNHVKTVFKKSSWAFALSFPIIFGLLFAGDYFTSKKKEILLIESAKAIILDNSEKADKLVNYSFNKKWINETEDILDLMSKTDENFPNVSVIVKDSMDNSKVLLEIRNYYGIGNDTIQPAKKNYLLATSKEEREYLNKVFDGDFEEIKFSASNGQYELFFPYSKNNKKMVLHFSDYQRYGKMGS